MIRARLAAPLSLLVLLLLLASTASAAPAEATWRGLQLRTGDVVLQTHGGRLGKVIQGVTQSPFDHCGMIIVERGRIRVIEAVGPVREVSLDQWVARGEGRKVAVYRPTDALAERVEAAVQAARRLLGRPYDIAYELDDAKIYCSELVWKAWKAAGFELSAPEPLRAMNWAPWTAHILSITGGELPLDRMIVSPVALTRSALLVLVHTDFTD